MRTEFVYGCGVSPIIRQLPHHSATPIIAVTAHTFADEKEKLIKAGMNDYLAKPLDEVRLRGLISRYMPHINLPEQPNFSASLDWDLALRQAANKPDLAKELLQMLVDFLPEARSQIEHCIAANDATGLRDIIHKLHGSASYSGVPRMKQLCQTVTQNLRANHDITESEPELYELLDEMGNVARLAKEKTGE